LSGLTVDIDIDPTKNLFGYTVDELQDNIVIGTNAITGTLKYIDDYSTAFGPGEDSGNYIAIHASVPDVDDVTITVTVTNPSVLDDDGICVCRIADKSSQKITVVASKEGYSDITKVYDLSGLTVEDSEDDLNG
jgi:hypothetical protein